MRDSILPNVPDCVALFRARRIPVRPSPFDSRSGLQVANFLPVLNDLDLMDGSLAVALYGWKKPARLTT